MLIWNLCNSFLAPSTSSSIINANTTLVADSLKNTNNALPNQFISDNNKSKDFTMTFTIIIAIFSVIFSFITFFTQSNLNKSEKLLDSFSNSKKEIEREFKKLSAKIEKENTQISDLISKNKELFESNSRLIFNVTNQFLEKDKQVPVSEMRAVLALWDSSNAEFAAFELAGRNVKQALPFLEERLEYYKKTQETAIVKAIEKAIEEIG